MKTLILVAIRYSLMFTAVTASLFSVRPAQAGYIVTLQQVGPGSPDVIATGSGSIDLTGLTIVSRRTPTETDIEPANGGIFTGPNAFCDVYEGNLSGPTSFGIGSATFTNSGSGDMVGIDKALNLLAVPTGYVSGTPLSNMATWSGKTLASLGVTPGTYVWTWGAGPNQNFTLKILTPHGAGPDFNGDGHPDLVLGNASTHQTVIWYMNNNVHIGGGAGPTLPTGWQVASVADFNRD